MGQQVAVDIGGTFTDVCVADGKGNLQVAKVPTSDGVTESVLRGLDEAGVVLKDAEFFAHGTTVATNALINRDFPRAALITTRGFRDVLEVGSGTKSDLWDAYADVAPPYIARRDRLVVGERIDGIGRVITPLDLHDAEVVIETMRRREIETVAICFVNSYVNPIHEREMERLVREALPGVVVSVSSLVLPEIQEHERFSTTVVNALLSPLIKRYTAGLESELVQAGYRGQLQLLHGGGGLMTPRAAERYAGRLASSGVAAGAIASRHIALSCGFENSIGLDIGGTSADISIVADGQSRIVRNWHVDYGHPICFPSLEVLTIGSGGGSLAWVDDGGALRVGPRSAGAVPGPACYGLGGASATTTDAQLVLGRLSTSLAGGRRILDPELAEAAVADVAADLACSIEDAAVGILRVASANMADALRIMSVRRGHDPRDFALVAFGGAGPLHAVELARELGIPEIVIPPHPGTTSALGCLLVDTRHDFAAMFLRDIDAADPYEIESKFLEIESSARESLLDDHVEPERMSLQRFVEVRYRGQYRTLPVAVGSPVRTLDGLVTSFHAQHRSEFGFSQLEAEVEIYQLSVAAFGVTEKPPLTPDSWGSPPLRATTHRRVRSNDGDAWLETPVFDREHLFPGAELTGPALVSQSDSTTLLPAGSSAVVDDMMNLRVSPCEKAARR
ncbi:hydantoinase/oxoprolinase family protein [Pseudonocardia xishanensis]|uniref:Hydantoinase/oxoprolinase family protein n=1 Tax=Pseudonocardia xishanensis TaxID=630995 RepID=A0ABP8RZB0_9PSEU